MEAVFGLVEHEARIGLEDVVSDLEPVLAIRSRSITLRPTIVFLSWNDGRQCMKRTRGLPVFASAAEFTW